MADNQEYLSNLLSDGKWDSINFIAFKKAIKPIFFTANGFMHWARADLPSTIKLELKKHAEIMIADPDLSADDLVVNYTNLANSLNQGTQHELFFDLPERFLEWPADTISQKAQKLVAEIKSSLQSNGVRRERAVSLISLVAEQSNAQSRKSTSGSVAEDVVELVLRQAGLKLGTTYGKQWKSAEGSDTDLIIPYAEDGKHVDVSAYIAVQSSSNDRVRLSSSELHKGGRRFLCSLNGCPASSKGTKDIGNELVGGYIKDENFYVVIDSEKQKALKAAEKKLAKLSGTDKETEITMAKDRVKWLSEFTMSFNSFAEYASAFK